MRGSWLLEDCTLAALAHDPTRWQRLAEELSAHPPSPHDVKKLARALGKEAGRCPSRPHVADEEALERLILHAGFAEVLVPIVNELVQLAGRLVRQPSEPIALLQAVELFGPGMLVGGWEQLPAALRVWHFVPAVRELQAAVQQEVVRQGNNAREGGRRKHAEARAWFRRLGEALSSPRLDTRALSVVLASHRHLYRAVRARTALTGARSDTAIAEVEAACGIALGAFAGVLAFPSNESRALQWTADAFPEIDRKTIRNIVAGGPRVRLARRRGRTS